MVGQRPPSANISVQPVIIQLMSIEKDIEKVKRLADEKEDENWKFRTFLKGHDMEIEELDSLVHLLHREVSEQIDCQECGNCCVEIQPLLDEADIQRLADALAITVDAFTEEYLHEYDERGELTFSRLPCPLQSDKRCTVYEHRPQNCRSFPHLHKNKFVFRLMQAVSNCWICPISYNVFEQLKQTLWDDFEAYCEYAEDYDY